MTQAGRLFACLVALGACGKRTDNPGGATDAPPGGRDDAGALTTVGVATISNATLSVYGRSFNTTAPGSFHWQTFDGTGAAPTNLVSNSAPYQWYSAAMTTEISPGDNGVLVRIKAGPSSGSLIVNRIEICMTAT